MCLKRKVCFRIFVVILAIFGIRSLTKHQQETNMKVFENANDIRAIYPGIVRSKNESYAKKRVHLSLPERFRQMKTNKSRHNFRLLLNPKDSCSEKFGPFVAVQIASATWEFERRNLIRRTWASLKNVYEKEILYLFFVGNDANEKNNRKLKIEFNKFKDIVQYDFQETYKNLSLKTQGQMKWLTDHCRTANFFMHVDDDVVPDVRGIVQQHLGVSKSKRHISCAKVFKPAVRRDGKWATTYEEYPADQYPLSCVGWCFVMPFTLADELYSMSTNTPIFHLEDVWVTGILREKIGNVKVTKMNDGERLCQHVGWPKDQPIHQKIIMAWNKIKTKHAFENNKKSNKPIGIAEH